MIHGNNPEKIHQERSRNELIQKDIWKSLTFACFDQQIFIFVTFKLYLCMYLGQNLSIFIHRTLQLDFSTRNQLNPNYAFGNVCLHRLFARIFWALLIFSSNGSHKTIFQTSQTRYKCKQQQQQYITYRSGCVRINVNIFKTSELDQKQNKENIENKYSLYGQWLIKYNLAFVIDSNQSINKHLTVVMISIFIMFCIDFLMQIEFRIRGKKSMKIFVKILYKKTSSASIFILISYKWYKCIHQVQISKFYHLLLVLQESRNVKQDLPNKLFILFCASSFQHYLQQRCKSQLYEHFVKGFVRIDIEDGINNLGSPLLQVNLRDVYQQVLQDLTDSLVLLKSNMCFFRIEAIRIYFQQYKPAIFILLLRFQDIFPNQKQDIIKLCWNLQFQEDIQAYSDDLFQYLNARRILDYVFHIFKQKDYNLIFCFLRKGLMDAGQKSERQRDDIYTFRKRQLQIFKKADWILLEYIQKMFVKLRVIQSSYLNILFLLNSLIVFIALILEILAQFFNRVQNDLIKQLNSIDCVYKSFVIGVLLNLLLNFHLFLVHLLCLSTIIAFSYTFFVHYIDFIFIFQINIADQFFDIAQGIFYELLFSAQLIISQENGQTHGSKFEFLCVCEYAIDFSVGLFIQTFGIGSYQELQDQLAAVGIQMGRGN